MDLDNFIIGKTKEERRGKGSVTGKKQHLLNKHTVQLCNNEVSKIQLLNKCSVSKIQLNMWLNMYTVSPPEHHMTSA
jgi:hypothetical protein